MKKLGVVILILAMVLAMVASFAGCGTSKDKTSAKQYMTAGDAKYDEAVKAYEQMQTAQADAVTKLMGGQTGDLDPVIKQLTDIGDNMTAALTAAQVEYDKILGLTGVDDYVTYANMQIDVIKMYQDLLAAGSAFITKVVAMFSSGETVDVMALMQSPDMQKLTQIGTDIQKQEKENENFKSEKKLAQ